MFKVMVYCAFLSFLMPVTRTEKLVATIPALYIFGDSTVDVGNNNFLSSEAPKANFPHYGIDYPHSTPTGRFTNGLLAIDFTARALGFLMSPPPFLSLNDDVNEFLAGVNFASAGSGILNATGENVMNLDAQIENFSSVVAMLTALLGKQATARHLTKSLVYLSTGNNDLFALYTLLRPTTSSQRDRIVATVLDKFRDQLKLLYKLGARKFAVAGTGLIGNIPALRLLDPEREGIEDLNELSYNFKTATISLLEALSTELEGFYYSLGDVYEFGSKIKADPSSFGLSEIESACCGAGELNAEEMCGPNSTQCSNPEKYYNWDRVHPTQAVYELMSDKFLFGSPAFVNPINIYQLVNLEF